MRSLTEHVVNALYVLKKPHMDWFAAKTPLDEKGHGLFTNKCYFSSCHYAKLWGGGRKQKKRTRRSLVSFLLFLYLRRLLSARSLLLIQNSFKSQRRYQALSGGDKAADLIRKGFQVLQPTRMTSLEVVGAEMLLKFNVRILYVCLVHRPPRKSQDSAKSGGISTGWVEFDVSEGHFGFHTRPKEMPWSFAIMSHPLMFLTSARC